MRAKGRIALRQYQCKRLRHIGAWHRRVANPEATTSLDSSVRFLLLWTPFNAIYDVAEMPRRSMRSPRIVDGSARPRTKSIQERDKLHRASEVIAKDEAFIIGLAKQHKRFLTDLSVRCPRVNQPDDADVIAYDVEGHTHTFRPGETRGIASLDNRVIFEDGHKVFEYANLDVPRKKDGKIGDADGFIR